MQTKWVVSGLVFVILMAAHNEWAAWAVVGAVLSSFVCKVCFGFWSVLLL